MMDSLNRKRSRTLQPLTPIIHDQENKGTRLQPRASRGYTTSSDIIPQTLPDISNENASTFMRSKAPVELQPKWSQVGFQSIFEGDPTQRRSYNSLVTSLSPDEREEYDTKRHFSDSKIGDFGEGLGIRNRNDSKISELGTSDNNNSSIFTSNSSFKEKKRHPSIFSSSKDSNSLSERTSKLFKTKSNKSSSSMSDNLTGKQNAFTKMTRKLFHNKPHRHMSKDNSEIIVPNSLSKFIHSSIGKHRSPVQFIHNTTGALIDSGKSVYSFNPGTLNLSLIHI